MATNKPYNTAAATESLKNIPQDISVSYLPNANSLSQKALDKAFNILTQGYIHDVKFFEEEAHCEYLQDVIHT